MSEYYFTVQFTRDLGDDVALVNGMSIYDGMPTDEALQRQFVTELQSAAYDDGGMAGQFDIIRISGVPIQVASHIIRTTKREDACEFCFDSDGDTGLTKAVCLIGMQNADRIYVWRQACEVHKAELMMNPERRLLPLMPK